MKNTRSITVAIVVLLSTVVLFGQTKSHSLAASADENEPVSKLAGMQADSIAPDETEMRNVTSVALTKEMAPGWNVGNSLEAIGGETNWGNPKITQFLIDSVKAAGFKTIRIPVAWSRFTDTSTFTIDTTWLNRVEEVVNYVLKDSLYAIINEHWDGGWQQPTYAQQAYVNGRLAAMWKQIAVHFRDYSDHLLFAGTNEVMVTNNYSAPTKEYYTVQNSFNQTFVSTVRSTGGRNYYRYLLVQGFNTNIDYTVDYFTAPIDVTPNRLIVEVHYYDPYDFTINTGSNITQWGRNATDPSKTETWANESYADGQFQKMKTKFIDRGYGVVLGEYGVIARINRPDSTECALYRRYYTSYVTGSIFRHGLVPVYWDNGGTGNLSMGVFDRRTGNQAYPDIIRAIVNALGTTNAGKDVGEMSSDLNKYSLSQNFPNPFSPRTTIAYSLPEASTIFLRIYDLLGREIATLVSNEREAAGSHEIPIDGAQLTSGVYCYNLRTEEYQQTKMMVLVK